LGIDGIVETFCQFDNKLITGGYFGAAAGKTANNIASWDGTSWSSLGQGVSGGVLGSIQTLEAYNNQLFAGGDYAIAGTISARNIARWNRD